MFRIYKAEVRFNKKYWSYIWIDSHYEKKHSHSINDDLILTLLSCLTGDSAVEANTESGGFAYYEVDTEYKGKLYRLILVIPPDNSYLGVRNTYRRSK